MTEITGTLVSGERRTAQDHLDYWVNVLRSVGDLSGNQDHELMERQATLRKIAKRETKRWASETRAEYRALRRKGLHARSQA